MCIMGTLPISAAYFINPFHQYVYLPIVARHRLGKNVTTATNTHVIEKMLDESFSMWSVSCERKVGGQFFAELLVSKSVTK
jgi:hypothetical protein